VIVQPGWRGGYQGRGLHGEIVDRLGQRIVAGQPAPGDALPQEPVLAAEYDVSRTVVREALRVLAAKGLVDARPMRGTRVRSREDWQLLDPDILRWALAADGIEPLLGHLLEIRHLVEPLSARLAAERASDAQRTALGAAFDALVEAGGQSDAFIEADLALHAAISAMAGNPLLGQLMAPVETALRLGRHIQVSGAGTGRRSSARSVAAHREVVSAIVRRDGRAAEAAMRSVVRGAAADAERALGRSLLRTD
jgi:GntR family transcriptional regulator, galactonate operon transcriptional repressor